MINAETQLLYSSDYPHWDFDLPSTIWDLPFLSEKAKHNILGGTAARLFKLPPRNDEAERESEAIRQSGWVIVRPIKLRVTPGLDPGVHADSQNTHGRRMDCRVKPGNDG